MKTWLIKLIFKYKRDYIMNSKFLQPRNIFISLLFLILFKFNALAQKDVEKIKKELEVRNLYTIIETNNGNIFAGTWGAGIWKSTDFGITWNRTSEGLLSYDIRKLLALDNNKIFAATASGLYYTNDAGLNWTALNYLDQKVGYRNIIINDNNIYVATDDGKIYKSQNEVLTWSQTGKIDEPIINVPMIISQNKMLVGTENGLIVSEDEGKTWVKSNNEINSEISSNTRQQDYPNISTSPIEFISSNRDGKMVAITSGGEVLISNDAGISWSVGSNLICAIPNTRLIEVKASEESLKSYIPPPAEFFQKRLNKTTSATINVRYDETNAPFPPEAKKAFQYAVDIWASIISSPIAINVNAVFESFDSGSTTLGFSINPTLYTFSNQPISNTFYPVALAEKLYGDRINLDNEPDMNLHFNSNYVPNFYFGTDGRLAWDQYDFVTLALHEICHGLGYTSGFQYSQDNGNGSWGPWRPYPLIFDRFLYNGNNQSLIDTSLFPNPSLSLGSQLTSNNIFWNSPSVKGVQMYAPATYSASSIVHLNYGSYPMYTGNRLMSPFLPGGGATHSPGDIVSRQMTDMGWGTLMLPPPDYITIRPPIGYYSLENNYPNPFNSTTNIQYEIGQDEFVKINVFDITGKFVKELVIGYRTAGRYNVEFNAGNIASGVYYYRIEAGDYKSTQKMMFVK
jgi:hypothetical protein